MQYSRYDCQKRRILDWNSGRRSRLQSWPTQQYLEIALIVWHQMVEIEYFYERLETPRPPRKVTLSKNWQCQQQHSTSGTQTYRVFLWQRQKSEDSPEVQDGSKHIFEVRTKLKVGSKKICIREDPVKESIELSQESTQAAQDMANVELIELRTSEIHQCPSCGHAVFKETILCTCGKHIRQNQEMIQRIRAAFHILKAPSFRTSSVSSRGQKHGHQSWQLLAAEAKSFWIVFSAAGIFISLTFVVLPRFN